ncbi:aromatic-l-amino-acid decarboxylase [Lasallia pustulata]|uniref:Aromatic-l-amino-acid decarboxylase n=1 Tax=Lasallia pustulata TaxID=136370 RepID=A0A1W5CUY0_9LECA|nr:aromatic-l-amino-acid decarboxylase [Lasallia pustulata]
MNSDEFLIDYYDTIQDRRVVSNVAPGYLRKLLPPGPPHEGEKWEDIQKDIESKIMPGLTHWQSPNFMAFFPASATYPSMLGELYSAAFTAPAFNWLCSPAVTELETTVLDWMARLMNLPACFLSDGEGGGVIQGSASEAIVTVMVAARERYLDMACEGRQGEEREMKKADVRGRMVALGSEQSHSSTAKAAIIAGVRYMSIPCRMDDDLALTGAGLQKVLDECKQQGLIPFYLTTTLGTTATCATDRFEEIKEVAKDWPDMWIHVDAAYAGGALVCEEYQHLTEHLEAFDSFDMNMHKWLLTNFDASCLYIKRRRNLTDALSITPSYLRNDFSDSGLVTDYRDWQIPLGRRFRSLKIWFVLRTYGVEGLKAHIRNHICLGERFHSWVLGRQDLFRVVNPPAFALTVLTVVPRAGGKMEVDAGGASRPGVSDGLAKDGVPKTEDQGLVAANRITKEVYELINSRGEIFLTSGVVNSVYTIRIVSANPKADEQHLRKAFDILVATAEEVLDRLGEGGRTLTNDVGGH